MSKGPRPQLDPTIAEYYNTAREEDRLAQSWSLLEALRTRELIERYAPKPPAVVLDVGGAAGAHALWLAELGYTVHLVDPVQRLVEEAQRRSAASAKPLTSTGLGDARALDFPDQSADIVLLLGPLYHLTEAADRARALGEVRRVLRPGGYLFAGAISRWASALDGLSRDLFRDRRFGAIVEQDLRDGQHRNPTDRLDYFTTAYFHRPDDLRTEVAGANLTLDGLYGLEGPGWILSDVPARLEDPSRRAELLHVARLLESEPLMLGTSAHLLVVARR
jgi:ubiquinone/menaquinone biosynthesis C-methylase UbiE